MGHRRPDRRARGDVPEPDGRVQAGREEGAPAGLEGHRRDRQLVGGGDPAEPGAGRRVPEPGEPVVAPGQQGPAVGAEGEGLQRGPVIGGGVDRRSAGEVPEPDDPVGAPGGEGRAVGGDRQGHEHRGRPLGGERVLQEAGLRVPEPDNPVLAADRGQAADGVEGQGPDRDGEPDRIADRLPRGHVPEPEPTVEAPGEQPGRVGEEGEAPVADRARQGRVPRLAAGQVPEPDEAVPPPAGGDPAVGADRDGRRGGRHGQGGPGPADPGRPGRQVRPHQRPQIQADLLDQPEPLGQGQQAGVDVALPAEGQAPVDLEPGREDLGRSEVVLGLPTLETFGLGRPDGVRSGRLGRAPGPGHEQRGRGGDRGDEDQRGADDPDQDAVATLPARESTPPGLPPGGDRLVGHPVFQVQGQLPGGRVSVVGVGGHRLQADGLQLGRGPRVDGPGRGDVGLPDAPEDLGGGPLDRGTAGQDRVEGGPQAVDVAGGGEQFEPAVGLLGAHVGGGPDDRAGLGVAGAAPGGGAERLLGRHPRRPALLAADRLGQAPVDDQGLAEGAEHDVARLEVPVEDAPAVRVGDGVADVDEPLEQPAEVQGPLPGVATGVPFGPVEPGDRHLEAFPLD